jgi:hypothetical protein
VELFPEQSTHIKAVWVGVVGLYALVWAGMRWSAQYKKKKTEAAQEAADESEYQQYRQELDIIRRRFDPERDLEDPTSISPEYRAALDVLHDKHHAMLERKFGPR